MAIWFITLTLLFSSLTAATNSDFFEYISPNSLGLQKEKLLHLHFFLHDNTSGPKPTAVQIAEAQTTNTSSTFFGFLAIADDPLTVAADPGSKVVGKGQGLYGFSDQNEVAVVMLFNFVFTEGKFNGSTLNLLGRNLIFNQERELAIVGGTGVFKFSRGYADLKTYSLDNKTGNAVVEYNIYAFQYY
ncbi:unnamed protein product [Sphenostylis stenocarpa]|uniref:Dirigent protein n=1 Tax=Sphenostylis stenocarpa TaxID=92480 RepID=A0AA86S4U7_9FABA|nr:unnamed protein product [Sphenostylis stenocarpa]